ncbi:SbcC/MukB-like Walker B domain-containing protein [Geobacter anodireducens]
MAGGLFDPAHDPGSPHHKALEDITAALQDPKAAEQLQDYRNFLVFEVEMCDTEGTPTADLEHRIQKGSGGENQTPYYVATGASLAAAYRIKETFGQYQGGMSLAVFDEAFSKLSVATCHSCIEFLKNIQLQLVVAAPDEKYATMAEVMDEIVWVTREGGTVDIEVIYIKPEMRAMLRSDNPYRHASGTAEFLHEPV